MLDHYIWLPDSCKELEIIRNLINHLQKGQSWEISTQWEDDHDEGLDSGADLDSNGYHDPWLVTGQGSSQGGLGLALTPS